MIDDLKKMMEGAGPGDIATILLAGTAGFVIDAAFNPVGFLTAPKTGLVCASGALGVKKTVDVSLAKRRERKAQKKKLAEEKERAERFYKLLSGDDSDKRRKAIARQLGQDLKLFDLGIIGVDDLKTSVDEAIKAFRDYSKIVEDSQSMEDLM